MEEELRLLKEAVERLPTQCRAAFARRVFEAQPYEEIARALGISTKTVEKHISRGIRETSAYLRHRYALPAAERQPTRATRTKSRGRSTDGGDG